MRGCLDYCMRRKGRFLLLLLAFLLSGLVSYRLITNLASREAPSDQISAEHGSDQSLIEVPKTGGGSAKRPGDTLVSDYSSGQTTVAGSSAQMGTFPFDFGRDLKPGMKGTSGNSTPESAEPGRKIVRKIAGGVFICSALALGVRFLSDRYLR